VLCSSILKSDRVGSGRDGLEYVHFEGFGRDSF
jgi:hypothetical protein